MHQLPSISLEERVRSKPRNTWDWSTWLEHDRWNIQSSLNGQPNCPDLLAFTQTDSCFVSRMTSLLSFMIDLLKCRSLVSPAKGCILQYFIVWLRSLIKIKINIGSRTDPWITPYLGIAWLELNPLIDTIFLLSKR